VHERAVEFLNASIAIADELGDKLLRADSLNLLGVAASEGGRPGDALALHAEALTTHVGLGDRKGTAQGLEGAAVAAAILGFGERSLGLVDTAAALRESIATPRSTEEYRLLDRYVDSVRTSRSAARPLGTLTAIAEVGELCRSARRRPE